MEYLLTNLAKGKPARRVILNGRPYLVAPISLIVPNRVLPGSQGPLFYPEEEVARNVSSWNRIPITVYHPFDPASGKHIPAKAPGVLNRQGVGFLRKTVLNGKLGCEGWFDEVKTRKVDNRVYEALVTGTPMEISTGLYTTNVPAPRGSAANGVSYDYVARNYRPDHLAILPDQTGACSLNDGCGLHVNQADPQCPT
jgi:hypothetical protein